MKRTNQDPRARQAALYAFPYHYLPRFYGRSFRQTRHWNFALSYLATLELVTRTLKGLGTNTRTLCDVGCGDGALLHHLSRRLDGKLLGVDVDSRALDWARLFNPDLEFVERDIVRTPLDRRFDVVTLIEVIEHVPPAELPDFLDAAFGLLRGGGVAIVTVPHANTPVHPKHFQHFTCDSLRAVLAPHTRHLDLMPFDRVGLLERAYHRFLLHQDLVVDSAFLNSLRWVLYRWTGGLGTAGEQGCRRIFAVVRK